jgi:hypothetical protein
MQFDSTFEPFEANPASPCPVCSKGDWCYLKANAKGVVWWAVCGRAKDAPEGWERTGTSKGSDRRAIYQLKGISHRRRKFQQDFQLRPRTFEAGPQWVSIHPDETFKVLSHGDRVGFEGRSYTIDKVTHAKGSKRWNIKTLEGLEVEAGLLLAGGTEQAIEYSYGENHKVVRRQWSDRRPWYDRNGKTKQVRPWHLTRTGEGDRKWEIGRGPKDEPWPIYREQEVLDAISAGLPFFVVGGEACVEALRQLGYFATCCQGGEGRWLDIFEAIREPLTEAFKASQAKSTIILWPDNDPTGQSALEELHRRLNGELHARAAMLNPLELWAKMPAGGDVVDWLGEVGKIKPSPEQITEFLQAAVDKAIDRAELAIAAQDRAKDWGAPEMWRGEHGFWRSHKDESPTWNPCTNWTAQILQEIHGSDGGGFILGLKLADEQREYEVRVTAQDCESKSKFQRALSTGIQRPIVCKLKDEHIQALIRVWMLNYSQIQGGKSYKLCKQMGCQAENPDGSGTWVFPGLQLTSAGKVTKPDESGFTWDETINDGGESIQAPAIVERDPQALARLCQASRTFFGDSYPRVLLCLGWGAAIIHYSEIFKIDDAFPLLNPYGDPGGGKTEAVKCGMALAGNHREGMLSGLSTSAIYEILKVSSNLPLCWDDPEESTELDELLKRLYNAKARLVRGDGKRFSKQKPHTSIAVPTNAAIGENQAATQSRLAKLFFPPLTGGDRNGETYSALQDAMDRASGALPDIIAAGVPKDRIRQITKDLQPHLASAHPRLARSWALFVAYGELVQAMTGENLVDLPRFVIEHICPELNQASESGDSVADFLDKVAILVRSSKAGPWNVRAITRRDGTEAIAIHLPSLWEDVKSSFTMSYNRGALQSLLNNRNGKPVTAKLQIDRQSAQDHARNVAKVRAEGGNVSLLPAPIYAAQKCHTIPREQSPDLFEFLKTQESAGYSGYSGSEWDEDESASPLPELPSFGYSNIKEVTQVTDSEQVAAQQLLSNLEKVTQKPSNQKQVTNERQTAKGIQPENLRSNQVTDLRSPNYFLQKQADPTVTAQHLQKGDTVVLNATARRYRKGSSPLPPTLPVKLRKAESALLVEIEAVDAGLFRQLSQPMEFSKLSSDGSKAQLVTEDGRHHAFDLGDVLLLKKAEVPSYANG